MRFSMKEELAMPAYRLSQILLFAFSLSAAIISAAEIPPGTHLLLRMVNSVGTRTAQVGDYVYLRTASPVITGGQIIVPIESYVQGVVSHTQRSGRVSGRAEMSIRLETLTLPGGKVLKVSPHLNSVDSSEDEQKVDRREGSVKQGATKMQDAGRVAILAGSGASLGGLTDRSWKGAGIGAAVGSAVGMATVLLTRGKEVDLRQGTTMDVVFDRPVVLE
jgi:hypothetical protein